MSRIIMTGGGTAGHVTPNIALLPYLKAKGFDIAYIGSESGMEKGLIEREGIPYYGIPAGKLRRYFDLQNVADVARVAKGFTRSIKLLKRLKPDVIFSKGGFVSTPVVWAGKLLRIPVIIHESDITPGLANRLSLPFADIVCCSFPETVQHIKGKKVVHTGIPIRKELTEGYSDVGRNICGFTDNKPVLLIIGGSQGSQFINGVVRETLDTLCGIFQVCHICGKGGKDESLSGIRGYSQFEYVIKELPHLFAMADVVLSRAGATTIFELLTLRKPNILVPLDRRASRGDQMLNAASFKAQGFSHVIHEQDFNPETLVGAVKKVYRDRLSYRQRMEGAFPGNSAEVITSLIEDVIGSISETA